MIEQNGTTEVSGLLFTQESWEENGEPRADIWVEDPRTNNTASLACAVQEGILTDSYGTDQQLTLQQHSTCERVMDWAYKHDLY